MQPAPANRISPIPAAAAATPAPAAASASGAATVDFENFLKLLTAQLRYQDPLAPLDSTQFVSQLASFSTVEQLVNANDRLTAIEASIAPDDLSRYVGWIGRIAETTDASVDFSGGPVPFRVAPSADAIETEVVLRDAAGVEIARAPAANAAQTQFWTPGAAPGRYRLEIVHTASDGTATTSPAAVFAPVTAARLTPGGAALGLAAGEEIAASAVRGLFDRAPQPAP